MSLGLVAALLLGGPATFPALVFRAAWGGGHGECSRKCLGRAGWGRTTGYLGPFGPVLESQPVFEKNRKSGPSLLLEILILFILSAHSWALPAARALGSHRATSLMVHCSQGWCCCHVYTKEMRRRVIKWSLSLGLFQVC